MKRTLPTNLTKLAFVLGMGLAMPTVNAALTDIANAPLANGTSIVKPNVMFVLDDSGSMNRDHMPDSVDDDPACKDDSASLRDCDYADPPYNSAQFNGIYYNPTITYTPAVNYDGTSKTSYTTWTAVPNDAYGVQFTGTIDLTTSYPDSVWCNTFSPTTADRTAPFASGVCKRPIQGGVYTYPDGTYRRLNSAAGTALTPYYYTISSLSWCSSANASGFGTGTCQPKKTATFRYPKYGTGSDGFTRTDIVSTTANYPRAASRTDCSGAVGPTGCTYAQEMTNFANWYAYYRTRMQMMKTGAGLAFKQVTDSFRIGFITINPGSPVASTKFLPMSDFTAGAANQKDNWYTKLYAQDPGPSTPLREALSRVGRYYGHVTTGINNGITDDPVQYSCQQNFTIRSTDGFWNGGAGEKLDGTAIGHQDSNATTAPRPLLDGSFELTNTTMSDTLSQQICTGNANAFGATPCGCGANLKRVKQQDLRSTNVVVSRDGVVSSNTTTPSTTYSDITACNAIVTTAVTTTTNVNEQAVNGNANTTFPVVNGVAAGANQAGSCAANFGRIKRRTTTATSTVVTTGGVAAAPVLGATYVFADVGACVALTNTVVTQFTVVEEQALVANATSTFGIINGVAAGANQAGVCAAGQARIKRRTTTYNQTVVTVGSTAGAPTLSATAYGFSNPGSCVNLTTTTTTPITQTAQWVSITEGTGLASAFSAAGNGTNPQTTYTCSGTGTRTVLLQRNLGYNRIVTTVGAGAPVTTFSGNTVGPTFSIVTACSTSAKTAAATTTVTGATSAPVVTGAPVPAGPSTNSSILSNTTTGGPSPGASTSTPGGTTSTSTGTTITSADFTIAPITSPTTAGPTVVNSNTSSSGPLGFADTLADVAQYYYITDLRAPGSLGAPVGGPPAAQLDVGTTNNVPGQPGTDPQNDSANWQHMTTLTLGLGVDGTLTYAADYRTNPTGDFLAIKNGGKNWPEPIADTVTAVDDLWHAALDGRGTYFSARDPAQLASGLSGALAGVTATTGSAAAAATSNLEPVAGDNFAYVASYETVRWNGDVEARTIDLNTGAVNATSIWSAQAMLDTLTNSTTPGGSSRAIKRFNSGSANKLQDFTWANLTATEQAYFNAPWISTGANALSHWGALTGAQQTASQGSNFIDFLRGDSTYESQASVPAANQLYRDRQHVLGDVVDGAPVYVKQVSPSYADAGFASPAGANFKECVNVGGAGCTGIFSGPRSATVYIAANDGMLHALDGNTGAERWAYIPNILIPKLYRLADKDYGNRHQYYVDGSPTIGDIYDPVAAKWKTILVGGLASGGRGFYALDVTDPAVPIGLWEFNVRATASCPSSVTLGVSTDDCDLGLSYGNPIITKLGDGTWVVVVTSGYNNVSPGDGKGYLYVLNPITGVILKKIQAANASQFLNPGSTATPLGLARINNWVDDTNVNNTTLRVYGADLQGYMWRFNLDTATAYGIVRYTDPSGVGQPVTTKPELGEVDGVAMIYVGTGRYLGASDLPSVQVQTISGIKDVTGGVAPATLINIRSATVVAQTLTDSTTGTGAGIRTATSNPVDLTTKNGWRVDLPNSGERVNVDPKLQLGTLIIGSNIPANSACTSGGTSYLNFLDYKTGGYIQSSGNTLAGVLLGNSLVVGISVVRLPNDKTVAIVTTSDNKYPNLAPPFSSPSPTGRRSSFRELQ
jgi:type IV pilus assembly protein PilY1